MRVHKTILINRGHIVCMGKFTSLNQPMKPHLLHSGFYSAWHYPEWRKRQRCPHRATETVTAQEDGLLKIDKSGRAAKISYIKPIDLHYGILFL